MQKEWSLLGPFLECTRQEQTDMLMFVYIVVLIVGKKFLAMYIYNDKMSVAPRPSPVKIMIISPEREHLTQVITH